MRLRAVVPVVAACLALLGPASSTEAAVDDFYGINGQALFDLPRDQWDTHLRAISKAGIQLVRRDASWVAVEPTPPDPVTGDHRYDWSRFDQQVEAYARHGLRWLPIIDYSTAWSGRIPGDLFSPPKRIEDYAAYAAALARRYGRGGESWRARSELPQLPVTRYQVWNEQNSELFWHPQDDAPEYYAELYLKTREAIRAVDPNARVIAGALALENKGVSSETRFVERMYRHRPELAGNVDAVGFHPYTPDADGVFIKLREFRETLSRHGAGEVPIEVTEIGWTTTKTSESDRAAYLARLAEELPRTDCGVESLVPHTWRTEEHDASNAEHWFGIVNADGSPKPSGSAYLEAVERMRASGAARTLRICGSGAAPTRTTASKRVRLVLAVSPRRRRTLIARGRVRGRAGGRVTLTTYYARKGRRLHRVGRRSARVRNGRFRTRLARFRRGRWRVRAALSGVPSAVDARKFRLEGEDGGEQQAPPGVRDDGRRALGGADEAPAETPQRLLAKATYGSTVRPGPLHGGGYLGVGFATSPRDVAFVQRALTAAGFETRPDGLFGPSTETAVRRFQTAHGLLIDGVVGRQTFAALKEYEDGS